MISEPTRISRLKLRTSPAITASGRARPARGARVAGRAGFTAVAVGPAVAGAAIAGAAVAAPSPLARW